MLLLFARRALLRIPYELRTPFTHSSLVGRTSSSYTKRSIRYRFRVSQQKISEESCKGKTTATLVQLHDQGSHVRAISESISQALCYRVTVVNIQCRIRIIFALKHTVKHEPRTTRIHQG